MDRRTLIVGLGVAATWFSISGCAGLVFSGRSSERAGTAAVKTPLDKQLAELADPFFHDYATGKSVDTLFSEMARTGVISTQHGINHDKLASMARYEPLRRYKGFYYTQTELDLYALAYLDTDTYPAS
ncbi:hypothetical protein [Marinobacter salicampi]|uniref:hypothetical protein n=1 Tax=Marinobacter salicampi TaxID=435907 RepID=UPI00140E488F|nr:hypothetical protein [Marinobacter salicampi]